jgi:predicted outer membrane repeat protein
LGGAIFNHQGEVLIRNSTLEGNVAAGGTGATNGSGLGGAIFNLNGFADLDSATVAANQADQGGGAIYNLGYMGNDSGDDVGHAYVARVTFVNTIVADSTGASTDVVANGPATVAGGGANTAAATVTATQPAIVESSAQLGTGVITGPPNTTDPGLSPPAMNGGLTPTMAITTSSSAFNVGATDLATDQRGITRPQGPADDIGAFELVQEDTTPPEVEITKAPKKKISDPHRKIKVKFKFQNEPGSTCECSLDGTSTICNESVSYKVPPGRHKFRVTATDTAGNTGSDSARFRFVRSE